MFRGVIARQFGRYSVVGALTAILYLLFNFVLLAVFTSNLLTSSLVAHLMVTLIAFYGNHCWTFMAQGEKSEYLLRYLLVSGVSMATNAVVVMLGQTRFPENATAAIGLVLLVIPIMNFVFHKYWTFLDKADSRMKCDL